MTTLTNFMSTDTMQSLGWALLHFLWQGTALAALAAAAMAGFRKPAARYLIGIIVLGFMLAAPVATFVYYSQQRTNSTEFVKSSPLAAADWRIARGNSAASGATPRLQIRSFDALPW